jgi:hypothetical protein
MLSLVCRFPLISTGVVSLSLTNSMTENAADLDQDSPTYPPASILAQHDAESASNLNSNSSIPQVAPTDEGYAWVFLAAAFMLGAILVDDFHVSLLILRPR